MVISGLNSFLGFNPKGKLCWGGDKCPPGKPSGGGGGGATKDRGIPGPFKIGGGRGGGGGNIAPLKGRGGGGGGNWWDDVPTDGTELPPCDDCEKGTADPGGNEPYWGRKKTCSNSFFQTEYQKTPIHKIIQLGKCHYKNIEMWILLKLTRSPSHNENTLHCIMPSKISWRWFLFVSLYLLQGIHIYLQFLRVVHTA